MKNTRRVATSLLTNFNLLKQTNLITEIFVIGSSSLLVNIFNFLFFVILSRYISIDSLGILNAQIGTLIVIANIVSLGIPSRIMHLSNQERVDKKVIDKKFHELIWGLIYACLISAVTYYSIKNFYSIGNIDIPFLLLCLILVIPLSDSFSGYLYGKKKALISSLFSTIDPICKIIFLLIFLNWFKTETIYETDIYNIYILSSFTSLCFLIYFLSRIIKPSYSIDILNRPKVNIRTYTESLHFGIPALTRTFAQWSPLIIISWITPEVAGIYFIYSRFVMIITAIPQKIIEAILVPMIYDEKKNFKKILNKYRNLIVIILLSSLIFIPSLLFNFLGSKVFPNYQEVLSLKLATYIVSSSILIKLINFIIEHRYISKNRLQLLTKIKLNAIFISIAIISLISLLNQNTLIISKSFTASLCIIIFELISIIFSSYNLSKINN